MSSAKKTTKKTSTKKKKTTAPKPVPAEEPETVEEFIDEEEGSGESNKAQELWGDFKTSMKKIPHGISEQENKLKITTSKLFALIGALLVFFEGRALFLLYPIAPTLYTPIIGGIGMLFGFILTMMMVVDLGLALKNIRDKIPYEWFIQFGVGLLIFFLNLFAWGGGYGRIHGGVILMIGGLILLFEGLKIEKMPKPKPFVVLIGIAVGIYETIRVALNGGVVNIWAIITAVIMFIILLFVFFATGIIKLPPKLTYPLSWWLMLSAAVAIYFFGFQLSGIILGMVFLLILIEL